MGPLFTKVTVLPPGTSSLTRFTNSRTHLDPLVFLELHFDTDISTLMMSYQQRLQQFSGDEGEREGGGVQAEVMGVGRDFTQIIVQTALSRLQGRRGRNLWLHSASSVF
ncbi:hypothetical protein WMY93_020217 [Mugilogobius chulae]|uniref:Uncharacterized protein n=1 Tax=Mugilogobius chulae TaxID=88201 RepID=A0AAW0NMA2_9GOBI